MHSQPIAAPVSDALIQESITYATAHGICMALPQTTDKALRCTHAPFSLLPTPIARHAWQQAIALSPLFGQLVDNIAHDADWLRATLAELEGSDEFTNHLLGVWTRARQSQALTLGLHRSDYMIDADSGRLLQVELNTIASSFGCLSSKISRMHAYLAGRYRLPHQQLPKNPASEALPAAIAMAHRCYCEQQQIDPERALVLFVVQGGESNTFDQLYLEYELFHAHGVRVERRSLAQIDASLQLGPRAQLEIGDLEASVVYFRAGYSPQDHPTDREWRARETIERSLAIKCPSIAYHLVGTKKVQQALASTGNLKRFVADERERALISASFAGLWRLCPETADVQEDALQHPENYVLKPQREGGGNNFYGDELRTLLASLGEHEKSAYILMERIFPNPVDSALVRDGVATVGPALAELGIFTAYIGDGPAGERQTLHNAYAGHIVRTKLLGVDEGGVATGFSCLSSPDVRDADGRLSADPKTA